MLLAALKKGDENKLSGSKKKMLGARILSKINCSGFLQAREPFESVLLHTILKRFTPFSPTRRVSNAPIRTPMANPPNRHRERAKGMFPTKP
jgi:hypothetical protein